MQRAARPAPPVSRARPGASLPPAALVHASATPRAYDLPRAPEQPARHEPEARHRSRANARESSGPRRAAPHHGAHGANARGPPMQGTPWGRHPALGASQPSRARLGSLSRARRPPGHRPRKVLPPSCLACPPPRPQVGRHEIVLAFGRCRLRFGQRRGEVRAPVPVRQCARLGCTAGGYAATPLRRPSAVPRAGPGGAARRPDRSTAGRGWPWSSPPPPPGRAPRGWAARRTATR